MELFSTLNVDLPIQGFRMAWGIGEHYYLAYRILDEGSNFQKEKQQQQPPRHLLMMGNQVQKLEMCPKDSDAPPNWEMPEIDNSYTAQ